MFLSDSARFNLYCSAQRQTDSLVAKWFLSNVGSTIPSIVELGCPFQHNVNCPPGWNHQLPWFDRLSQSSFTFGAGPVSETRAGPSTPPRGRRVPAPSMADLADREINKRARN